MATAKLPLLAYETTYTWSSSDISDARLVGGQVRSVLITRYGISPGCSAPSIDFKDSDRRLARGSAEMFYQDEASAQAEIDEAMKNAKENPPYKDLKAERDTYREALELLANGPNGYIHISLRKIASEALEKFK
jgi:hypothetical protein